MPLVHQAFDWNHGVFLWELLFVDREGWKREAASIHEHYGKFGDRLPAELWSQLEALEKRLR